MARSYRDLIAWQKGMNLVTEVYAATRKFPKEELFCLTSQLRRSAISIPSNIAEGNGRAKHVDRSYFLFIARGSTLEVQTQIEIATRLGYLDKQMADNLIAQSDEVGKVINGLLKALDTAEKLGG